jgi:GAF domain-containing protein
MTSRDNAALPAITDVLGSLTTLLLSVSDVEAYLQEVSRLACAVVEPPASCGITTEYNHQPITLSSNDGRARSIDQAQYEADDGPCLHALRTGTVVEIADQAADQRWPQYRRAALEQGVVWVLSQPLKIDGGTAGAMNLYGYDQPHALAGEQRHNMEVFATQAATALALAVRHTDQQQVNTQLEEALASRSVIDQAMGVLMAEQRCTAETAFALLRRQSQRSNTKLREVAASLIAGVTGHEPAPSAPFARHSRETTGGDMS